MKMILGIEPSRNLHWESSDPLVPGHIKNLGQSLNAILAFQALPDMVNSLWLLKYFFAEWLFKYLLLIPVCFLS
jgi:hypothetical protein